MLLNVGVTPLLLMIRTLISAIWNLILDKDAPLNHNCNQSGGDVSPFSVGFFKTFIWLHWVFLAAFRIFIFTVACGIFSCGAGGQTQTPTLREQRHNHWATREGPPWDFFPPLCIFNLGGSNICVSEIEGSCFAVTGDRKNITGSCKGRKCDSLATEF